MFKKVTVILFVLLLLSSCSLKNINLTEPESASFDSGNDNCPNTDDIIADEYRGVWINYNELSMKSVGGGTAEDFKNKIDTMSYNTIYLSTKFMLHFHPTTLLKQIFYKLQNQ